MIICHKYRFIFFKTRKTAGTSLEIALSRFCDENDTITPLPAEDGCYLNSLGHPGAQNFVLPLHQYSFRALFRLLIRGRRAKYHPHSESLYVREYLPDNIWSNYYKFCFDRNPWDKVISMYWWRTRSAYWLRKNAVLPASLSEFITSADTLTLSNWSIYADNNKCIVDHVGKYENLAEELIMIQKHLNLPDPIKLPVSKTATRQDARRYTEVLSAEDRATIQQACHREIKLLGYSY
jgi:hypothetical protein